MDSIQDIMGRPSSAEPLAMPLEEMMGLASTEQIRKTWTGTQGHYNETRAARMIAGAIQRDVIQAGRPEGCWCLGAGGKEKRFFDSNRWRFAKYCSCPEGVASKDAGDRMGSEYISERAAAAKAKLWNESGIPHRFTKFRLHGHPYGTENPELIQRLTGPVNGKHYEEGDPEWQRLFDDFFSSWYFWGDYGRGKTGLAIGYAWESAETDESLLYRPVTDLLSELRSTYGRHEGPTEIDLLSKYTGADLLILDEIGAEHDSGSGWLQDRLYQIIGKRHAENKRIVFTSNLSIKQLGAKLGERIAWRIVEMCGKDHIVEVKGKNLRDLA